MQEKRFDPLELIKQILVFLALSAVTFIWCMLVLLIISFVALSYITLKLKWMIVISIVIMICIDAAYIIEKVRRKKKAEMQRIRQEDALGK
ncbi:MAG: hypothetical protein J5824_09060 [Lachnospiraceae bacterium]|nr:hypothetical protein [Lachnospiraceae bacterium]